MNVRARTAQVILGLAGLGLLALVLAATAHSQGSVRPEQASSREQPNTTADGDLPVLYVFSGVTDDGEQGSINRKEATSIHCTNLSLESAQVEVQIYQWNGTDIFTGTANLLPNRTLTFSTQNTTIYYEDVFLGGTSGTAAIFQGSGRILTSQLRVICTAQVLDPLNYPPAFMDKLPLYTSDGYPVGELRKVYLPIILRGYAPGSR